jgi:hypothetical protein
MNQNVCVPPMGPLPERHATAALVRMGVVDMAIVCKAVVGKMENVARPINGADVHVSLIYIRPVLPTIKGRVCVRTVGLAIHILSLQKSNIHVIVTTTNTEHTVSSFIADRKTAIQVQHVMDPVVDNVLFRRILPILTVNVKPMDLAFMPGPIANMTSAVLVDT